MDWKMAFSPYFDRAGGGSQRFFTATAIEFTPKRIEAKAEVLSSSFITQTIPRVHRYAGIIGLCTVPEERAGMNDLGWHIADFLAFRALLCGENPPKAQTWLSQCDIAALVEANPERYVHGKDKRLVGFAAKAAMYQSSKGLVERKDNIQVETSAEILKDKLVTAIKEKMTILKKQKYPLVLIICGMTSLEQDIYFGKLDIDHRCTLSNLRSTLGDDINHVETIVVTPSLFSAGWQMNTAFGRPPSASVRANRAEFLARQFGGLFAKDLVENFLGWECPVLDVDKVDPSIRIGERFPGPAWPSDEVKALISKLQVQIHSYLIGQLSAYNMNHSFSFDNANDEWSALIAQREKPLDYRALDWYEGKWNKLQSAQSVESTDDGLAFLGNAFGGTKMSQVNHIRYLIEESYLAWPDHWASNFGHETKKDIERFLNQERPEDLDCHEIFNVLEHRATTSTLADVIIQYFDLPMPHNQRCRDWDYLRWKEELPEADRSSLIKYFGTVLAYVPGPNVPPGVNPNHLSKLQRRLENAANYVRASLGIRFLTSKDSSKVAIDNIHNCK
ncbi:hypothetical protein HD806DRAFT_218797 [Xylariaceae sp. AK1471]|nr:hypothetical protein HD806DRAFT_218797 [Xylariaceae sp. AK1471]